MEQVLLILSENNSFLKIHVVSYNKYRSLYPNSRHAPTKSKHIDKMRHITREIYKLRASIYYFDNVNNLAVTPQDKPCLIRSERSNGKSTDYIIIDHRSQTPLQKAA